jgi:hypothetical protein
MKHASGDQGKDLIERFPVRDPETRVAARRVGEVKVRVADAGIDTQAERQFSRVAVEPLKLRYGIEDNGIGELFYPEQFALRPGNAVGVGLAAEFFASEPRFEKRARRGAVHVMLHEIEHAEGRKAL